MNTLEAIKNRRSCKNFNPEKKVPQDIIDRIITAGTQAASGKNMQAAIILQVEEKKVRDQIVKLNAAVLGSKADTFYGAQQMLIVLADKNMFTHVYDGSIVMANMMLAAEELGIGSCWIHRAKEVFETEEGKEILRSAGIEGEYEGIGNLAIGYPAGDPRPAPAIKDNYVYKI